jgi:hypothetical protein
MARNSEPTGQIRTPEADRPAFCRDSNKTGSRQRRGMIQVMDHHYWKMHRWLKIDRSVWIARWRGPAE